MKNHENRALPAPLGAILVADGSPQDTFFLRRAFLENSILNPLFNVCDGEETLNYLNGNGMYADRLRFPFPNLLLMEVRMPVLSGLEVLAQIRQTPAFSCLPVIMLAGSNYYRDIQRARELGANSFILKPFTNQELNGTIRRLAAFWLNACVLPDLATGDSRVAAVPGSP